MTLINPDIRPAVLGGFDTREQLANILGVSSFTIRRWEKLGLPVIRRGNLRLYDREKVRRWLAEGSAQ